MRWGALVVIALVACHGTASAPAPAPRSVDRIDRLVGLADLWIVAKFAHPAALQDTVDVDGATVAAIRAVEDATTADAYRAAIEPMLAVFHDPATHVVAPSSPAPTPSSEPWIDRPVAGVVVVSLAALAAPGNRDRIAELAAGLPAELAAARIVVFDVRAAGLEDRVAEVVGAAAPALPLISDAARARTVVHHGYRTQVGQTSGGYTSAYEVHSLAADTLGRSAIRHVVFIADGHAAVPAIALGLQASGRATILAADPITDDHTARARTIALPYGVTARVRVEQIMMPDGTAPAADVIAQDPRAAAVALATELVRGAAPPPHPAGVPLPAAAAPVDDRDWPEQRYPSRELRLFGAIKMWGVIATFYPYLDLVCDWDAQLPIALAGVERARTAPEYADALRRSATQLRDGHATLEFGSPLEIIGRPLIDVRRIGDRAIVTASWDPAVAVGDELIALDGEPIEAVVARQREITSAGTPAALANRALLVALAGPRDRPARVTVRGADGVPRIAALPRDRTRPAPAAPHYRLVAADIGYAELATLTRDEVDPMFSAFAQTRTIILDLRGYPLGTAWRIVPHINTKHAELGAAFERPVIDAGERGSEQFFQRLPADPTLPLYAGKIVVLIDDRAVSHAEHSALFFEAASDATFIGTHTHGTNGDITVMRLPGGLQMMFTGQAVRHADGRQLQQIGIEPTIEVAPTIAGLRAGRDEVLERALASIDTSR